MQSELFIKHMNETAYFEAETGADATSPREVLRQALSRWHDANTGKYLQTVIVVTTTISDLTEHEELGYTAVWLDTDVVDEEDITTLLIGGLVPADINGTPVPAAGGKLIARGYLWNTDLCFVQCLDSTQDINTRLLTAGTLKDAIVSEFEKILPYEEYLAKTAE